MTVIRVLRSRPPVPVFRLTFLAICFALMMGAIAFRVAKAKSRELPPSRGVGRTIENKGSDTLVNLALAWAEVYMQLDPKVSISVTGGGSGTGIAAMVNGTVSIANASREMKPEETAAAEANGIVPVEFIVARDAIAVVVNRSNPVQN